MFKLYLIGGAAIALSLFVGLFFYQRAELIEAEQKVAAQTLEITDLKTTIKVVRDNEKKAAERSKFVKEQSIKIANQPIGECSNGEDLSKIKNKPHSSDVLSVYDSLRGKSSLR